MAAVSGTIGPFNVNAAPDPRQDDFEDFQVGGARRQMNDAVGHTICFPLPPFPSV